MYWSAFIVSKHTTQLRLPLALPVHDAIAVKQGDAEWTDETLGCKTRFKVDYPDELKSENNNFT